MKENAVNNLLPYGDGTKIWYRTRATWEKSRTDTPAALKPSTISNTHRMLALVAERDLNKIWSVLQDPEGIQDLLKELGLSHTSISIGDVLEQDGKFHMVDTIGFREMDENTELTVQEIFVLSRPVGELAWASKIPAAK